MKSNCCNAEIRPILTDENTGYYICLTCKNPCDPMKNPAPKQQLTKQH